MGTLFKLNVYRAVASVTTKSSMVTDVVVSIGAVNYEDAQLIFKQMLMGTEGEAEIISISRTSESVHIWVDCGVINE